MKKSLIILYSGSFVFLTSLLAFLGSIGEGEYNWWFLIIYGIVLFLFIVFFLISKIIKNIKSDKLEKVEEKKEFAITPEECEQRFREFLLKPEYADMIYKFIDGTGIESYGEDKTPIYTIVAKPVYNESSEYYYLTNMMKPERFRFLEYDPLTEREKFERKLKEAKNLLAESPSREEIVEEEPFIDPSTGQYRIKKKTTKISKEELKRKEEEKQQEEVEGFGGE